MQKKNDAKEIYNDIVADNLKKIEKGNIDDIKDPDKKSMYCIEIEGVEILLSQDGLCSKERIIEFNGDNKKSNMRIIT